MDSNKRVLMIIMDGWGLGLPWGGNTIYNVAPPFVSSLWQKTPNTKLRASGMDVGLLPQTAGNSEAGHLNLGSGRVVGQDLSWITHQIDTGEFFRNQVLNGIFASAKNTGRPVHIVGLLSDGGIHAQIDHMYALLELAAKFKPLKVYFHVFGDGRDTEPHRIIVLLERLQKYIDKYGLGEVVSIVGRYYAMDRDRNFDRTKVAYDLLVKAAGDPVDDWNKSIQKQYDAGKTDEYLPAMLKTAGAKESRIKNGDFVIITNYRADRIWQLEAALHEPDFAAFPHETLQLAAMVSFVPIETAPNLQSAMTPPPVKNCLGDIVAASGINQLRVAESEKGAHVTYFFNGGKKGQAAGEYHNIVPSPKEDYAQVPEMSAYKLYEIVNGALGQNYNFILLNLANPDMVGHTGNMEAGKKAVKVVDGIVGRLSQTASARGFTTIVTADHGNIDEMVIPYSGEPSTDHSNNLVPFFLIGRGGKLKSDGRLCDVAPTILHLLDLPKPAEMTGQSLIAS